MKVKVYNILHWDFIYRNIGAMKQLSDADIERMADGKFNPDERAVRKSVRGKLGLGQLIPAPPAPTPTHATLDLHHHTVEQAWGEIMALAKSGTRRATIITGASGVLKAKFPQWATDSVLSPYIYSFAPINNGSFAVQFTKVKGDK